MTLEEATAKLTESGFHIRRIKSPRTSVMDILGSRDVVEIHPSETILAGNMFLLIKEGNSEWSGELCTGEIIKQSISVEEVMEAILSQL